MKYLLRTVIAKVQNPSKCLEFGLTLTLFGPTTVSFREREREKQLWVQITEHCDAIIHKERSTGHEPKPVRISEIVDISTCFVEVT